MKQNKAVIPTQKKKTKTKAFRKNERVGLTRKTKSSKDGRHRNSKSETSENKTLEKTKRKRRLRKNKSNKGEENKKKRQNKIRKDNDDEDGNDKAVETAKGRHYYFPSLSDLGVARRGTRNTAKSILP